MAKVKGVEKGRPKVDAGMCAPSHDSWLLTLASVYFFCFIDGCFLFLLKIDIFFFLINVCLFSFCLVIWESVLLNMYGHALPLIFVVSKVLVFDCVWLCGCECKRSYTECDICRLCCGTLMHCFLCVDFGVGVPWLDMPHRWCLCVILSTLCLGLSVNE